MGDPRQDQKQPQLADLSGSQGLAEADLIGHLLERIEQAEDGSHGGFAQGGLIDVSVQGALQRLDAFWGPGGEVGQGARLDLAVLAEGLPQEDGRRRGAVGDALCTCAINIRYNTIKHDYYSILHAYISTQKTRLLSGLQQLSRFQKGNFRRENVGLDYQLFVATEGLPTQSRRRSI